jgi:hypothetical protein
VLLVHFVGCVVHNVNAEIVFYIDKVRYLDEVLFAEQCVALLRKAGVLWLRGDLNGVAVGYMVRLVLRPMLELSSRLWVG